jgi:hypothetical protein
MLQNTCDIPGVMGLGRGRYRSAPVRPSIPQGSDNAHSVNFVGLDYALPGASSWEAILDNVIVYRGAEDTYSPGSAKILEFWQSGEQEKTGPYNNPSY